MGMYARFKSKVIINYYHVSCTFKKMRNARIDTNVIKGPDEIDGFECLSTANKEIISRHIQDDKDKRTAPLKTSYKKKAISIQAPPKERRKTLKTMETPSIKILFTNADQFTHSKKNELIHRITTEKPMIIAISEVKIKNSNKNMNELDYDIEGYSLHPVNIENDQHGRGIIVYTHNSLDRSTIQIKSDNKFQESCLLEIRLRGGDVLLLGCLYRSPTPTPDSIANNENLNQLLKTICLKSYSHVCLVGDFNYKDINWKTWTTCHDDLSKEVKFIEAIRDCFLFQHIDKPTRIRGNDDPSLIDLILTNEEHQISDIVHHAPLGKSDHSVITFNYQCYLDHSKPKSYYAYRKADWPGMTNKLVSTNWTETFMAENKDNDPETIWSSLKSKLLELRNEFVPKRCEKSGINASKKGTFPLDKNLQQAIREKHRLHRRWIRGIKSGNVNSHNAYIKSRNKAKKLIRQSKRLFEKGIASRSKSNPKEFWKYVRKKLKTKGGVSPLLKNTKDPDSLKYDDKEKADILQDQFSGVFIKESHNNLPQMESRTEKQIRDIQIIEKMVRKEILALNINKSCGPDEISPLLLTKLIDHITNPLVLLMNTTIKLGALPNDWKQAYVSPIYKKGSRNVAENYRPISLTSVVCKLMEKIVKEAVLTHLIENNLLSKKQFGFVSGRTTVTQLLNYFDKCAEVVAKGGVVDSIYFDFSKAFDTVPHKRLSIKLKAYGIEGNVLEWIEAFLSGREQVVRVNGELSDPKPVISGIPQGSVLGPLLFVVYINDLPDVVKSNILLFADDTKIFLQVKSIEDSILLQKDIDALERWSTTWLLKFNIDKCHVLTLGKIDNIMHTHRYELYKDELDHVFEEKDLGVVIDMELTFEEHMSTKIKKANGIMGLIRRTFSFLDIETFKQLYTSFVRPHLEYAQPVWSPHLRKHIKMVENVQIRATKLVDGLKNLDYAERLDKLGLPTLLHRRERGDMIQLWKHFNSYDRSTLSSNFKVSPRSNRNHHRYQLTWNRAKDGVQGLQTNSFYFRTPNIWNHLPTKVVEAKVIDTFKSRLDEAWINHPTKRSIDVPSVTNDQDRFGEAVL